MSDKRKIISEELRKVVREEVTKAIGESSVKCNDEFGATTPEYSNSSSSKSKGSNDGEGHTPTFEDFYRKREVSRQQDFSLKSKRKKTSKNDQEKKEVEIKVNLASQKDRVIKPCRGKSMFVRVSTNETKEGILSKAVKKHESFDQSFDNSQTYTLLYSDFREVHFVPGTKDVFTLSSYRDAIGKDYKRLVFYLIPFDEFYNDSSDDDFEDFAEKPSFARKDLDQDNKRKGLASSGNVLICFNC